MQMSIQISSVSFKQRHSFFGDLIQFFQYFIIKKYKSIEKQARLILGLVIYQGKSHLHKLFSYMYKKDYLILINTCLGEFA